MISVEEAGYLALTSLVGVVVAWWVFSNRQRHMASPASLEGMSVAELLALAKQRVDEGKSEEAMDAVVRAIRDKCGQSNVESVLETAKQFANEQQAHAATGTPEVEGKSHREILQQAVSGAGSLLEEEYSDAGKALAQQVRSGESRVCTRCGDVVATTRLQAHSQYWCAANPPCEDSDSD